MTNQLATSFAMSSITPTNINETKRRDQATRKPATKKLGEELNKESETILPTFRAGVD